MASAFSEAAHRPSTARAQKLKRYVALDGWRGLCACLVAFYHFSAQSHISNSAFIRSCFLCVDFFFVLSGFVITENYRDRMIEGFPAWKFILLRLGRVYPLHLFILVLLVAHESLKGVLRLGKAPFSEYIFSLKSLVANVFLVQSLGFFNEVTWNGPSWSISTEFYTYILFALVIVIASQWLPTVEFLSVLLSPLLLAMAHSSIDVSYDWGLLRCVYGFSAGALCYRLQQKHLANLPAPPFVMTLLEVACLAAAAIFMPLFAYSRVSVLCPILFSFVLMVFVQEKGAVSRLLQKKPFVFLGTLSYSVYMTHLLIQSLLFNAATVIGHKLGINPFENQIVDGRLQKVIATPLWQGDLLQLLMLALVVTASYFTYTCIEKPANDWFRKFADQLFPVPAALRRGAPPAFDPRT